MKLTAFSNYALRTLQFAALRAPGLTRIDEVADAHGINRAHIVKIVHLLGREGYLVTRRGRGGGFALARPPEEISVGAILRLTEGPFTLVECHHAPSNTCPLIGACRLSTALARALDAFLASLDAVTIADIAANRGPLLARLEGGIVSQAAGVPQAILE